MARVRENIRAKRLLTIREVAEEVRIAFGTCQKILTEDLQMRRVTAKFVPCLLMAEQKDDCVSFYTELHEWAQNDPNFMSSLITGDECWVYGYDPETKKMSSQRNMASSPRPNKAQQVNSNVKTMLIVFFDIDRLVVHHEYVSRGQTVNKEFYRTVLQCLRDAVCKHRPEKWRSGSWILHHDNASAHGAVTTNEFLAKHNICCSHTLPTPLTSLHVTSCSRNWRKQWKLTDLIRDSSQHDKTTEACYKKWLPDVLLPVAGTLE